MSVVGENPKKISDILIEKGYPKALEIEIVKKELTRQRQSQGITPHAGQEEEGFPPFFCFYPNRALVFFPMPHFFAPTVSEAPPKPFFSCFVGHSRLDQIQN